MPESNHTVSAGKRRPLEQKALEVSGLLWTEDDGSMPDADGPIFPREWPLLAGVLVMATGAATALSTSTQSTSYPVLIHTLIVIGTIVSFIGLASGKRFTFLGVLVMAGGLVIFLLRADLGFGVELLFPVDLQMLEESSIAVLGGWMLCGLCFMQGGRDGVVFMSATSIAILGLIATVNVNTEVIIAFWIFISGLVYTWGYESLLRTRAAYPASSEHDDLHPGWARWHVSAASLLISCVLVVATVSGSLVYRYTPNIFERMSNQVRHIPIALPDMGFRTCAGQDFLVGTGPINLPETLAFHVEADQPALWRTQVFDRYLGHGWSRSDDEYHELRSEVGMRYALPHGDITGRTRNRQVFTFPEKLAGFLPAAAEPIEITLSGHVARSPLADTVTGYLYPLLRDQYGCLSINPQWTTHAFWTGTVQEPARHYEVISMMPPTSASDLRGRGSDYPAEIVETCIKQVPVSAEAHLSRLVNETIAGIEDPYDRVTALRQMLEQHCLYTLKGPRVPPNVDAAAYFINVTKRGACDLFATALAVTARIAGVPARIATGYQVGEYDTATEQILVKHSDAHAWAEIYFPDLGWVPFDIQAAQLYEQQSWFSLLIHGHGRTALMKLSRILLPLLLVPLIAYAALSGLFDLRRLLPLRRRPRHSSPASQLGNDYRHLCRQLARRAGLIVDDTLTPRQVIGEAMTALTAPPTLVQRLWRINDEFYNARYAPDTPARHIQRLRRSIRAMQKRLREFRHIS